MDEDPKFSKLVTEKRWGLVFEIEDFKDFKTGTHKESLAAKLLEL